MRKVRIGIIAGCCAFLLGCSETKKVLEEDLTFQSTQDNTVIEAEFESIDNQVQAAVEEEVTKSIASESIQKRLEASCFTTEHTRADKKIVLTFDSTTSCADTRVRKGQIVITYTGRYRDEGAVISTSLSNYYVDGNKIEGTRVVTNKGLNEDKNKHWGIVVTGGKITYATGQTIVWNSNKTRVKIAGDDTQVNLLDDVFEVYGTSDGVNKDGREYDVVVEKASALHYKAACIIESQNYLPSSGVLSLTPKNTNTRTIDYGDGTCDRTVSVGINGKTYPVTIPSN